MKRRFLLLTAMLCSLLTLQAVAQSDSTQLDLGKIRLNKNFTQTITVKGEDLERIPFSNLSEALNVWFYGLYSNKSTLVYVIDGMAGNDVNAYSIHDIESATLVQNALAQLNGTDRQQQLVLITTRKGKAGAKGITAAGNIAYTNVKRLYHQYYLSAYNNTHKVQYGVSAGYLHEALGNEQVIENTYIVKNTTAPNFDRFRINAHAATTFGKHHTLTLQATYAPQDYDLVQQRQDYSPSTIQTSGTTSRINEYVLTAQLQFKSSFGTHLRNELSAMFLKGNTVNDITVNVWEPSRLVANSRSHNNQDGSTFILRDNLSYYKQIGNWSFTPAINMQFSTPRITSYDLTAVTDYLTPPVTYYVRSEYKRDYYLLTPSLAIAWKNMVQVQGGVVQNVSPEKTSFSRTYPFATITADVLKMIYPATPASIQVFGSFAKHDNFGNLQYSLTDFAYAPYHQLNPSYPLSAPSAAYPIAPDLLYRTWQTGARFKTGNGRWEVNYMYERRDYTTDMYRIVPLPTGPADQLASPDMRARTHHIGILATVIQSKGINWQAGLQATSIMNTFKQDIGPVGDANVIGDFQTDHHTWVGGLTNRLRYKAFSAGLNIQYVFNQHGRSNLYEYPKMQLLLQNIHIAYQLQAKHLPLDVYISCRNLADIDNQIMRGSVKFYGIGFKASL